MSYNSGPMADDWDPQERNVTPAPDDEQPEPRLTDEDFWGGSTHFHRYVSEGNQRSYGPGRPRGTSGD